MSSSPDGGRKSLGIHTVDHLTQANHLMPGEAAKKLLLVKVKCSKSDSSGHTCSGQITQHTGSSAFSGKSYL